MPVSADPLYHSFPQLVFIILPGFSEQTRTNMGVRTGLVGLTLARLLSITSDLPCPRYGLSCTAQEMLKMSWLRISGQAG